MILSTKFRISTKDPDIQTLNEDTMKIWCNDNLSKEYRMFCNNSVEKAVWYRTPIEMEMIFEDKSDKLLFDLTWAELIF